MSKKREKLKFSNLKLRQNKSSATSSPSENEKISSYFPKVSQEIDSQVETDICEDSPGDNDAKQSFANRKLQISSSILDMSSTDANCFKSPRVRPKKQVRLTGTQNKVSRRKTVLLADKELALESTALHSCSDVNAEHLHMALAMSRSLQDQNEDECPQHLSSQQKAQTLKETLEQFGFKADAKISRTSFLKPIPQRRKKNRFLQTALMTRTEEDRKIIIEDKVAQIITNIATYQEHLDRKYCAGSEVRDIANNKPSSFVLRELYQCEAPLFRRGRQEPCQSAAFHGPLVDPEQVAITGALLRDWHSIPGRERTPSPQPQPLPQPQSPSQPQCVSPELFSDEDYPLCKPGSPVTPTSDTNRLNDCLLDHDNNKDIFHFESFNDAVCFDLTQSSTSLSPDFKNRDKITSSSDDSREMLENDACLNLTNAIQIINSEEKEVQDVVDLTQNSKDSELEFGTAAQVEFNDSKIEYLIRKAASNKSRDPYCDLEEIKLSNNNKMNVTGLEDLICDAASTSSRASMCDQVVDILGQCITVSDDEEMPPDLIPSLDSPMQADILQSSQSSVGSRLDDAELNYSSLHSESIQVQQASSVSDDIKVDKEYRYHTELSTGEEQQHFSLVSEHYEASTHHPCVLARLSQNGLESRTTSKLFNESLEKILEENDPWANDVIELHADIPECGPGNGFRAGVSPVAACTSSRCMTPIFAPDEALIIKTHNVTPMANYHEMDTPERNRELDKYGIKPLKRAKGVKILEYIYSCTHPVAGLDTAARPSSSSGEEEQLGESRSSKRRKKEKYVSNSQVRKRRSQRPPQSASALCSVPGISIVGDLLSGNDAEEDFIFERTLSSRVSSCRIPLHIAWYNFLCSRPDIQENILLYEPLQLEDIYLQFKNLGFKFHIQDLTTFFDKRCITIRTTQNNKVKKFSAK